MEQCSHIMTWLWSNFNQNNRNFFNHLWVGTRSTKAKNSAGWTFPCLCDRTTESTSSCGSAGMTPGWSFHQTSSPILWPLTPRCSSVCGNLTCSLPMRRAPTSTTSLRRISSCSYSGMETFSLAWGSRLDSFEFFSASLFEISRWIWEQCKHKIFSFFPGMVYSHP